MSRIYFYESYTDGYGQTVLVHPESVCKGQHCVIHNPSEHSLLGYPTFWDDRRKLMYRVVRKWLFIIDPDELAYQTRRIDRVWCKPRHE